MAIYKIESEQPESKRVLLPHSGTRDDPFEWISTGRTVVVSSEVREIIFRVATSNKVMLAATNGVNLIEDPRPLIARRINLNDITGGIVRWERDLLDQPE
ncbi:hypothetical protein HYS93_01725 [Candidatus Daviesbacteria bacterium]|nr:hypothetical protein [Candidatus Daviesbacteria bacterium]